MTSEEGQRPWGGVWPNKLHMGIFFFEKALQQGSVAHAETSGKWGRRGQCKGQQGPAGGGEGGARGEGGVSMEGVGSGPGLQTDL